MVNHKKNINKQNLINLMHSVYWFIFLYKYFQNSHVAKRFPAE